MIHPLVVLLTYIPVAMHFDSQTMVRTIKLSNVASAPARLNKPSRGHLKVYTWA